MKKLIYSSLILGSAFALASCSADEPGAAKGDGNVSLTVQLPADVATRFGDASTINKLYYSICTVGTETTAAKVLDSGDQEWPLGQTSTTVDLQLVPGQEYQVVFFACNTAAEGYKYTASNATLAVTYGADMINNDAYDAFSAVKGEISTNTAAEGKTITLTRPFAQLNIGTNDFKKGVVTEYLNGKNDNDEDNSYSSTLSIGGLATDVNFLSNKYTTSDSEVTFNLPNIREAIGGYPVPDYSYLEMNYLLVDPATANASGANLVDATYAINADGLPVNSLDLTNLPLRANYQTNVYGSLLTQKASFTVEINQNFADFSYAYGQIPEAAVAYTDPSGNTIEGVYVDRDDKAVIPTTGEGLAYINANWGTFFGGKAPYRNYVIKLYNNIDFKGYEWVGINNNSDSSVFAGIDGQNYAIHNLTIVPGINNAVSAMFWGAGATPGSIKNLYLNNVNVNCPNTYHAAVLVSCVYVPWEISNVHIKNANITGKYNVATFVGRVYSDGSKPDSGKGDLTMTNCSAENVTITSTATEPAMNKDKDVFYKFDNTAGCVTGWVGEYFGDKATFTNVSVTGLTFNVPEFFSVTTDGYQYNVGPIMEADSWKVISGPETGITTSNVTVNRTVNN